MRVFFIQNVLDHLAFDLAKEFDPANLKVTGLHAEGDGRQDVNALYLR